MTTTLDAVRPLVDLTLSRLAARKFREDPLLGPVISKRTSLASSAQRRHGHIIEAALCHRLSQLPDLTVWKDPKFAVSSVADNMVSAETDMAKFIGSGIAYGQSARTVQIDAIVYNKKTKSIRAYEIKRGNDHHDAGKNRSIIRDLACVQVLLQSYGEDRGLKIRSAMSHIVFYYGQGSISKPFSLKGNELDVHFGHSVVAEVETVNDYLRKKLVKLLT